jgi:c-di-GMP-binding flagellar brake protein YcgR
MGEKRDFVRIKERVEVEYKVIIDKFANTAVAPNTSFTNSLSGNGMTLLAAKKIQTGTKLEMTLKPSAGKIEMAGEVIGNKEISENQFEAVIKFIQIDEAERQKLLRFVAREGVKSKPKKK